MKRIVSILFALVLVLSFSLVMAVPAVAETQRDFLDQTRVKSTGTGTAEWVTDLPGDADVHDGHFAVHMAIPQDTDIANVIHMGIQGASPLLLSDITTVKLQEYLVSYGGDWDGSTAIILFLNDPVTDPPAEGTNPPEWGKIDDALTFHSYGTSATQDAWSVRDLTDAGQDWQGYADSIGIGTVEALSYWQDSGNWSRYNWEVVWISATVGAGDWDGYEGYIDDFTVEWTGSDYEDTYLTEPRVINETQDTGHNYIQDAIDAANLGDTITVATGTYVEDLAIPVGLDDLELKSASSPIIKGVTTLAWANWPLAAPNIEMLADGVKIHGFTIESPSVADGYYSSGMVLDGTDVEIYDNSFVSQGDGDGGCVVIQTYRDDVLGYNSDISGLDIHDNDFSGTPGGQYVGVFINHTLTGAGTVCVQNNTFSGNPYQGIVTERSNTTIKGNTLQGSSGTGIIAMDWDSRDQNNVEITGNDVSDFTKGILIGHSGDSQHMTNISVTENTVHDNDIGIQVSSAADGVVVNYNNIYGNSTYGVQNTSGATLDAEKNWWGHASGPSGENGRVTKKGKVIGKGDAVSDYVDWNPWLPQPVGHTPHDPVPPGLL